MLFRYSFFIFRKEVSVKNAAGLCWILSHDESVNICGRTGAVMGKALVSVIVPVYNTGHFLGRCMESILAQSYPHYEVLLIDDGSTDGSGIICDSFDKAYSFIHTFHGENRGTGYARNFGLKVCKGEYVTFIDSDDYVEKNYLERLLMTLMETESDICYCHAYDVDNEGNECSDKSDLAYDNKYRLLSADEYSWTDYLDGHFTVWGGMYRRQCFDGMGFPEDLSVGEDTFLLAQVIKGASKICSLHERLYDYVILDQSAFHTAFSKKRYDEIIAWERICSLYENENDSLAAYAVRMQLIWKKYRSDPGFGKQYRGDLSRRYGACVKKLFKYWIRKQKFDNVFKTLMWSMLLKISKLLCKF